MSDLHSSVMGGSYAEPAVASARIQFRRALTLTAMTLVMPGSAQLVMGNKRVGRACLRIWVGLIAVGVVLLIVSMTSRTGLFSLATNSTLLTLGRWLLIAGAIAWVALLVDAWRLGRPRELHRKHQMWVTGVNAALCFVTAGVMFFAAHMVSTSQSFIGTVFASSTTSPPVEGRYNVLLLGGDAGPDRSGVRPDSLTVASIDAKTGRTVLIGLPRNLEDVPFPAGSVMHKEFPKGFDCEGCYLNSVNTWANDHADRYDVKDPGLDATMDAVSEITGLKLNYYAMVNMKGFSKLIDAVGGVRVNVRERTAIGGIGSPIRGYIEAGNKKLTGDQALWYSRSRVLNNDFSRMGRQKCVMNAMLQQMSPQKVLLNVGKIASSGKELLSTDIPQKDLDVFMDLAFKAKSQKISTVSLVPPVIFTGNPDYAKVRRLISSSIDHAEGKSTKPAPKAHLLTASLEVPKTQQAATAAPEKAKDPIKANQSTDLGSSC